MPRSRVAPALACFALLAAGLAAGVVWASDEGARATPSLALCMGGGTWTLEPENGEKVYGTDTERSCSYAYIEDGRCIFVTSIDDEGLKQALERDIEQRPDKDCPNGIEWRNR